MVLRGQASGAQKSSSRAESRGFSGVCVGFGALANGRKTVCQPPSARHKKFLLHRETRSRSVPFPVVAAHNPKGALIMDDQTHAENGPAKAVSQLGDSLANATESHRVLLQEMTLFAKDEGLRFVNLRLERNGQAMDKLQNCQGLPGLIGVQQEWLRDLVQDYISHNMRLAGAFRGLTQNVMASAAETASDNIDRMQHQASGMVHQAGEQMDQAAQDVNSYVQQTQH
jgi:hypothetical protein